MIQILLIIQIVVTVVMIATILLQRSSSDGLGGLGGGQMASISTDNSGPMAKLTGWLGAIFMINCLAMATITARSNTVEDDILKDLGANARIPVQMPSNSDPEANQQTDKNTVESVATEKTIVEEAADAIQDTIDDAVDAVKQQGIDIKETLNPTAAEQESTTDSMSQ